MANFIFELKNALLVVLLTASLNSSLTALLHSLLTA